MPQGTWTTHYFGMLTAMVRRDGIHPDGPRCADDAPCHRCRPLLDTIAYNRARTPRWVLVLGETAGRVTEAVYAARDHLTRRRPS
ncbi:hypothetical protein OOK41_09150 [Micromonospora sp. NBC_01655]|uniref:hypothetical protein n=1 Tax=Micromonospora sp. NBC_01655 TaxID=2975983 RepID=UPI00225BBA43|nr:hypothetical protein [Micromonospora sp. NBC_01655]MCX4470472.1 hypothetical protein [Micromonospora sp. NBC_01655]